MRDKIIYYSRKLLRRPVRMSERCSRHSRRAFPTFGVHPTSILTQSGSGLRLKLIIQRVVLLGGEGVVRNLRHIFVENDNSFVIKFWYCKSFYIENVHQIVVLESIKDIFTL